ncbi:TetR/AcrR family transcriptional regulator [Paenibacillus sp. Y412MC10]|uniref:TetR/AcrR family transcriptional regulator n=1 Tax=Geobacillus sp. (strain Y412MC10) TaxID=481743 RepID=UPI0011A18462
MCRSKLREKIITASWELQGSERIENFTVRKLANQLDIKAASLYGHFKSKQQIFHVLDEEVVKRILSAFQDNGDWSEQLFRLGVNIRKQLQSFPCSAQLLM